MTSARFTDTPLLPSERARRATARRDGEQAWYDRRRAERPRREPPRPVGSVALPRDLIRAGRGLRHEAFVPPEARVSQVPMLVEPERPQLLRRFSGRKVVALNSTFLDGADNRALYYDDSYPWGCIGRISVPGGWGTATLAGENFIITASHVVNGLWTAGEPLDADITFVPAMNGTQSLLGASWSAKVVNIAAWAELDAVVGYDLAICQLDQPMGDWLGYFGSRDYDDGWEDHAYWEHVGYPYDLSSGGTKPSYQLSISVDDDDSDDYDTVELETDADIASGQSGGPLWAVFDDGGNQIIGVCSGHEGDEDTNVFAGGSGLNSLVRWGRDNW